MAFTLMTPYREVTLNLFRIVTGLMFMQHGAQKHIGWFGGFGGQEGNTAELFSLMGLAGMLEFWGGLFIVIGLFTRPIAFVLAGQMAVAYFMAHFPNGPIPILTGGELPALYSFAFLFFSANGAGSWSLDRVLADRKAGGARTVAA